MTSRTHDIGAFATLVTAAVYFPPSKLTAATIAVALVANIVGALLPDLDQASNRLWDLLPGGNFIGKILRNLFLAHRTISHSILGLYITFLLSGWLLPKLFNSGFINVIIIIYSLMFGYISHLVLDFVTEEGIPLLWPIKWKFGFPPWKHLRIRTDSWVEHWLVLPGLVGYIIWLVYTNWLK